MNILSDNYSPSIWNKVREDKDYKPVLNLLKKNYKPICEGDIPAIKFSEFRLFSEIGDRTVYQKDFFRRQHRLFILTFLSLIYPENEGYFSALQDTIFQICDMYVWALPAHMPNIVENNNEELDLDSTTIAYALATIQRLFKDRLHPLINARIDAEIDRRITKPFFKKRWHWEFRENNWTAVCSSAVGCTLMLNNPDAFELAKDRINSNMQSYIDSYKDDGVCAEGAGYWSYGFGYFIEYADLLYTYSNHNCNILYTPKVLNIATFFQKIFLDKNVILNFGDCGNSTSVGIPVGFFMKLKSVFGDKFEMPLKNAMYHEIHYFPFLLNSIICFDKSYKSSKFKKIATYYMKDQAWFVKRTSKYGFGAKGGHNGESHNHNDVGSFIFSKDDKQILVDMGGRPYTRQYFEQEFRYTFIETSSAGHNLPIVNNSYQAPNIPGTNSYSKYENGVFSVEFHEMYGLDELKELKRTFECSENKVKITDSFKIEGNKISFKERLVSFYEPSISDGEVSINGIKVLFDKKSAKASFKEDIHALELDMDGNIKRGMPIYLIDIDVINPKDQFSFEIEA